MKHPILILAMLFLISNCGGGSRCNSDEDGSITENAKVYNHFDWGFTRHNCDYIIHIMGNKNNNKIFLPNNEEDLDKFFRNDIVLGREVKITYRIIKEIKPGDNDKHCYVESTEITKETVVIIEIICIDNKPI